MGSIIHSRTGKREIAIASDSRMFEGELLSQFLKIRGTETHWGAYGAYKRELFSTQKKKLGRREFGGRGKRRIKEGDRSRRREKEKKKKNLNNKKRSRREIWL